MKYVIITDDGKGRWQSFEAEAYKERGEERAERIIRSKIDGSYKNKPVVVTLDWRK